MEEQDQIIPDCYRKEVLVLGCGNVLFGDDGFGPAVAQRLQAEGRLPASAEALDVGTGVREILFTLLLSPARPRRVIIVDSANIGAAPGAIASLRPEQLPAAKAVDFSLHQTPTAHLLKELANGGGVDVVILAVQPDRIPDAVSLGLSPAVSAAIPPACEMVAKLIQSR